ncbi:MAG: domain S-box protein [Mucilaginibacter sp.]|nr:domain S-box protein [Mucilaginibacter sp.]
MNEFGEPSIPIEEQFRIVANMAPALIWMAGIDRGFVFFNIAWLNFTGRTLQQEYGNGWTEGIHPDDLQHTLEIYAKCFDARKEFKVIYRLKRHYGKFRRILNHGVPGYNTDGTFTGYIGSCMDIEDVPELDILQNEFISNEALEKEQRLNEELASTNEELSAANEELVSINEELKNTQEKLARLNHELEEKVAIRTKALLKSKTETQELNEELSATNEELAAANEELLTTNEELHENKEALQNTVDELVLTKGQVEKSEKLFKSIAINIPKSLIIVIGKDHRYITIEGDLMVRMGYDSKDYTGKHPAEVSSPERYEATRHLYDRVLSGEQFTAERKGETGGDYRVDFVPLKNEDGEVYAGLIIALDITDIKQAEERSAKLAAIVESSDDAIISKTLEGVITSWNNSAERMFGYPHTEMIGQPILKLIPEDRQSEEPRILDQLRRGERVEHFETKRVTRENKVLDVSLTISPIKDSQGNVIGISKIVRDISEKKQDELRKNDFIGMVSHELKTPLTSLTTLVQVLNLKLKNSEDTFISSALDKADVQVRKMGKMINGFLNISRLESGKILIEKQQFDLEELIDEMIQEIKLTVSSHQILFERSQLLMVDADRDKIGSVISNLLTNAVKYSPKGKLIELKCEAVGNDVQVSIKDEGIGINVTDQKNLFERYYRVQNNQTRHISGFGIGLYLSAEIIKRHDGNIWVESEINSGSTFYFSLPLVR